MEESSLSIGRVNVFLANLAIRRIGCLYDGMFVSAFLMITHSTTDHGGSAGYQWVFQH